MPVVVLDPFFHTPYMVLNKTPPFLLQRPDGGLDSQSQSFLVSTNYIWWFRSCHDLTGVGDVSH